MTDYVRVLRVVEYMGPREWVERSVEGAIHGTKWINKESCIRAATIGDYPELLGEIVVQTLRKKYE